MFTGAWEIKRTRNTLHQIPMFSVNETFEFGAKVRPYLSEIPSPTLELISQDVRTAEEIERDLMREAEGLTDALFSDMLELDGKGEPEQEESDNDSDQVQAENPVDSGEVTKFSAYRALVTLAREQAETLWIDKAYRQRYYNQLPLSIQVASGAGLTPSEISAALQIGEFLGNRDRQAAGEKSGVIFDARGANGSPLRDAVKSEPMSPSLSLSQQTTTREVRTHEGLRARLRREHVSVRTRQPKPKAPAIVPVEWMEREHIQKRLPYLAEGIARLEEDELASLTESFSEVLEETFWTVMGITLAHYIDHEQRERTA